MDGQRVNWVDLLDPTAEELDKAWNGSLFGPARDLMLSPATFDDLPRPKFETHGDYVFGVFLVPVLDADDGRMFHQEIDLVLTADSVLTVRKTPRDAKGNATLDPAYDVADVLVTIGRRADSLPGHIAHHIVDDVAESFLDLTDALDDTIDNLEDQVDRISPHLVQRRISELRHDLLHIRRTLSPSRDAVRRVVDGRIELDDGSLFPRELEVQFGDVYDKLLRAGDGMETARELLGGVRDYMQAKVGNDQNEVMKRLTVSASLLLVPTFIVGLYGQNFQDIPELRWANGYLYSWGLIIVTTIAQLVYFRHRRWI